MLMQHWVKQRTAQIFSILAKKLSTTNKLAQKKDALCFGLSFSHTHTLFVWLDEGIWPRPKLKEFGSESSTWLFFPSKLIKLFLKINRDLNVIYLIISHVTFNFYKFFWGIKS